MQQVISPLDQALSHGGRPVVSTVYEQLQALWKRVDLWSGREEQVLSDPMKAIAGLLRQDREAVEAVRKGRAEATLAYLKLRPSLRGDVDDGLAEQVRQWRAAERSVAVQRILDEALGVLA